MRCEGFGLGLVVLPVLLALAVAAAAPRPAAAQVPVIEVGPSLVQETVNTIQNLTTMTTTVNDLANQAQQLANQVQILQRLVADGTPLSSAEWARVQSSLATLSALVRQGQAIAYDAAGVAGQYRARYPGFVAPAAWPAEHRARAQVLLDTLAGVLASAGANVGDAATVQTSLDQLRADNDTAVGQLAAIQTASRVASLQVEELAKLRQLMAAQTNAMTVYYGTVEQERLSAEAAFERLVAGPAAVRPYTGGFASVP